MFFIKNSRRFLTSTSTEDKVAAQLSRQRKFNRLLFKGALVVGAGTGTIICLKNPNCPLYDGILPLVRKWADPEFTHNFSLTLAKYGLTPTDYSVDPPVLYTNIKHLKFFNPIGMASGYDKNCEAPLEILRLGFGFIEVGSVLPKPQPGNPKPRVFRLNKHEAIVNSYGFPSLGLEKAVENMRITRERQQNDPLTRDYLIGVSIGKNSQGDILKDTDYCIQNIGLYADYVCVNVSSPNTPNLRDNQRKEPLIKLVKASKKSLDDLDKRLKAENLSYVNTTKPDLTPTEMKDVAQIALDHKVDGLVLTNTTVSRPDYLKEDLEKMGNPKGGLSGKPIKETSKRAVFEMYKLTRGKVPIIACGGISNAEDALEMIEAGASACQLFTSLVYQGPKLPSSVKKNLANLLMKKGYKNIQEAVGSAHRKK